jgi:cobalt/nickel transport system permease protein
VRRIPSKLFIAGGIAVAFVLAFFVSPYASSHPDGLEKVSADKGIDAGVEDHAWTDGPLADYTVEGVDNSKLGTGLAGLIGVTVTFATGVGVFAIARVLRRDGTEGSTAIRVQ